MNHNCLPFLAKVPIVQKIYKAAMIHCVYFSEERKVLSHTMSSPLLL